MPKPLLTDEMIQQAAREKERLEREIAQARQDDTQLIKKFAPQKAQMAKNQVYKSRRIESQKREERGKKITKYIVILLILLVIITVVVFKF
ncbi:cell wall synthase accessory phosphoprotein MacP [Pseudolactococcus yaeyamensis]